MFEIFVYQIKKKEKIVTFGLNPSERYCFIAQFEILFGNIHD